MLMHRDCIVVDLGIWIRCLTYDTNLADRIRSLDSSVRFQLFMFVFV